MVTRNPAIPCRSILPGEEAVSSAPSEGGNTNHSLPATGCVCPSPGWCDRHGVSKVHVLWNLCRTRQVFFDLWEAGRGPGQASLPLQTSNQPGLTRKAWNYGTAVLRHAADGRRHVNDQVYQQRLELCRCCSSCDVPRMVCREPSCGCQLHIKARWRSEQCPLGKWPQAIDSD